MPMPETTMDIDDGSMARKNDIGAPGKILPMERETITESVQDRSNN